MTKEPGARAGPAKTTPSFRARTPSAQQNRLGRPGWTAERVVVVRGWRHASSGMCGVGQARVPLWYDCAELRAYSSANGSRHGGSHRTSPGVPMCLCVLRCSAVFAQLECVMTDGHATVRVVGKRRLVTGSLLLDHTMLNGYYGVRAGTSVQQCLLKRSLRETVDRLSGLGG